MNFCFSEVDIFSFVSDSIDNSSRFWSYALSSDWSEMISYGVDFCIFLFYSKIEFLVKSNYILFEEFDLELFEDNIGSNVLNLLYISLFPESLIYLSLLIGFHNLLI